MSFDNLKKLQKLVATVDGASLTNLTREELQQAMSEVIDFLGQMNEKNRGEFSQVAGKLGEELRNIKQALSQEVGSHKNELAQASGVGTIQAFRERLDSMEGLIRQRLAELRDGQDGISPAIEDVINGLIPHIPKGST
jgi:hypothetical protein